MKFLVILLLIGLTVCTKADVFDEYENIGFLQAFAIHIMTGCPYRGKIMEEQKKAVECVKNIRSNSSFCDTFVKHFKPCIQGLLEESKKCEKPSDFAIKNTVMDSVIEEARYVCGTDGEHILEILNPCTLRSVVQSEECRYNLTRPLPDGDDLGVICRTIPGLQKCFEDEVQHECENEITRNTIHDFLSVDAKPCNIAVQLFFELRRFL